MRYFLIAILSIVFLMGTTSCKLDNNSLSGELAPPSDVPDNGDDSPGDSSGFAKIVGAVLDSNNQYVDVTFDLGIYGDSLASAVVEPADFSVSFNQNSGSSIGVNITSLTQTNGSPLVGGETVVRFHIDVINSSQGVENFTISPVSQSVYSGGGEASETSEITSTLTVNPTEFSQLTFNTNWAAYNDTVGTSVGNVTSFGTLASSAASGVLIKYADGLSTGISVSLNSNNIANWTPPGSPGAGTDAHDVFDGILDLSDIASMNLSGPWHYEAAFTGLDPAKYYVFIAYGNRNGSYDGTGPTSRWAKFTISGADQFTNASSLGTLEVSEDIVKLNTGANTTEGEVVVWMQIQSSTGSFTIRSENVGLEGPGNQYNGYGFQGFVLMELQ